MNLPQSRVLEAIARHARTNPDKIALEGAESCLSYAGLAGEIDVLGVQFSERGAAAIGLFMDNSPAWVVADLAAVKSRTPLVPIPLFFSPDQIAHLIVRAGLELVLTDQPEPLCMLLDRVGIAVSDEDDVEIGGNRIRIFQLKHPAACTIPDSIAKVTFTSGTTGDPKGVCLRQSCMEMVAESLADACAAEPDDRHLCALPLATLLENIGGVYAPLLAGGICVLPGLLAVGMQGASGFDGARFFDALKRYRISTCIMIPQMLTALLAEWPNNDERPRFLRYLAVGGAPVAASQLERAAELELPVFEGYGLSEASSVVAVNRADASRPGSVGIPLPHVQLAFAGDGEILVRGALFDGYLGQESPALTEDGYYPSGDIGYLDEDGFLHISGRKKHIFITAFGRNVSPEWVERELTVRPGIAQAVVFGEARAFNVAVLVAGAGANEELVEQCVAAANVHLPDYARVHRWMLADAPFTVENGLFTGTGRPRRAAIWQQYGERIEALYAEGRNMPRQGEDR